MSAATTLIVLFNLKPGVSIDDYERWARDTDLPTVRALDSVQKFEAHRVTGLLGADGPAPYQYVEVLRVSDMARFGSELASETMQRVAGQFQGFADQPFFMLTESVES